MIFNIFILLKYILVKYQKYTNIKSYNSPIKVLNKLNITKELNNKDLYKFI